MTAWENSATPKNGFDIGESIIFKVWRQSDNKEIEVVPQFDTNPAFQQGEYKRNGLTKVLSLNADEPCTEQTLNFHKGWNLVSINVAPKDLSMSEIFSGFGDLIVKNAAGQIVYAPQNGINNGTWNITEGYMINVANASSLTICGEPIDPNTAISLPKNNYPYFLPYFQAGEMPVADAIQSIESDILYVQSLVYSAVDNTVKAYNYIPGHVIGSNADAIDQIGMMKPGLAYKTSMMNAVSDFKYPVLNAGARYSSDIGTADTPIEYFNESIAHTGQNGVILVPETALSVNLQEGDELGVYAEDGSLAGVGQYEVGTGFLVTVWNTEGMNSDALMGMKLWKNYENEEVELTDMKFSLGDGTYQANTLQIVQSASIKNTNDTFGNQLTASVLTYPNPGNGEIKSEFYLSNDSDVSVKIYNVSGMEVAAWDVDNLFKGTNTVKYDVSALDYGQYIVKIQTNENVLTSKLLVK